MASRDCSPNAGSTTTSSRPWHMRMRRRPVGHMRLGDDTVPQWQVARQRNNATERLVVTQAHVQRRGAALREPGQDDSPRRDPGDALAGDVRLDARTRGNQPCLVVAPLRGQFRDVIPGTHRIAGIDGYRPHVCMRKDEPDARAVRKVQFRNHGHEVVAISAEPMHPDHGGIRIPAAGDMTTASSVSVVTVFTRSSVPAR